MKFVNKDYDSMTDEEKKQKRILVNQLWKLHHDGCTDSDIEDFCEETGLHLRQAYWHIHRWIAPSQCRGCKNIVFYRSMYPCNDCSRICTDHYQKEENADDDNSEMEAENPDT